jgi:tRNA G37 N-methylase TrmD
MKGGVGVGMYVVVAGMNGTVCLVNAVSRRQCVEVVEKRSVQEKKEKEDKMKE